MQVTDRLNSRVEIAGVLVTMFDKRAKYQNSVIAKLEEDYGSRGLTFSPQLKQGDSQVIKEQYISASPV